MTAQQLNGAPAGARSAAPAGRLFRRDSIAVCVFLIRPGPAPRRLVERQTVHVPGVLPPTALRSRDA